VIYKWEKTSAKKVVLINTIKESKGWLKEFVIHAEKRKVYRAEKHVKRVILSARVA
jgi:hypothetical protein